LCARDRRCCAQGLGGAPLRTPGLRAPRAIRVVVARVTIGVVHATLIGKSAVFDGSETGAGARGLARGDDLPLAPLTSV